MTYYLLLRHQCTSITSSVYYYYVIRHQCNTITSSVHYYYVISALLLRHQCTYLNRCWALVPTNHTDRVPSTVYSCAAHAGPLWPVIFRGSEVTNENIRYIFLNVLITLWWWKMNFILNADKNERNSGNR